MYRRKVDNILKIEQAGSSFNAVNLSFMSFIKE